MSGQLSVDLAHHDIQRADDRGDIRDQAAAAKLVCDREIAERAGAGAGPPGNRTAVADNHEAHLTAWAFRFEIGLTLRQLGGELDWLAPIALGRAVTVHRLTDQIYGLHHFQ